MRIEYRNPKKVKGVFIWEVNSKFLSNLNLKTQFGTNLRDPRLLQKLIKKEGDKLYFVSGNESKNMFFVWFSRIKDWESQKKLKVSYSIQPTKTYKDTENNNLIDFFDFSTRLNKKFQLKVKFEFRAYEIRLRINSGSPKKYNEDSSLYKRYTKSEKYLEQTEGIKQLARDIIGKEKNYFKIARKIFDWITENIAYKYPPEKRGVIPTLENKQGDCGEFSLLFIALCRSVGVPARFVSGAWITSGRNQKFHAWAEFYLEGVGWIPVDCAVSQGLKKDKGFLKFIKKLENPTNPGYYFGNLDNKRIIFSKGNNILLKNCPKNLSTLEMMWDCRSLFMQPTSIYPYIAGRKKGVFVIEVNPDFIILSKE